VSLPCQRETEATREDAGEKESRVSRVSIRFGSAVAPAGSWPFVILCMEHAAYARGDIASDTGMQHAPFRITRWRTGKEARGGRDARVIETSPRRGHVPVENSSTSVVVIRRRAISRANSRRMEFSSGIMPRKPTASISRLFPAPRSGAGLCRGIKGAYSRGGAVDRRSREGAALGWDEGDFRMR